jgi:hypothetical protein
VLWLTLTNSTQVGHDWRGSAAAAGKGPWFGETQALPRRLQSTARLNEEHEHIAATLRPTEPQRRYLQRGLTEPGGKLPLFDRDGRAVAPRTIQACIAHGWAEPWFNNPLKPDWLVCRLTAAGYAALGETPPGSPEGGPRGNPRRAE